MENSGDILATKRKLLKDALIAEKDRFKPGNHDASGHDYAIEYLTTGICPVPTNQIENYDILDACINDFEQMVKDYTK